ncbi:MAG TPA: redoxin domain-containing protein [Longimicrobiaceae bacterium]|nr:redoxin domain-containing protein [Longimicrobiaceae bacterium]
MDVSTTERAAPDARAAAKPVSPAEYNYEHFHPKYLLKDAKLAAKPRGVVPGDVAPDFELRDSGGRSWRLSDLRGKPVVLITGSATCPLTHGSVYGLREVHRELGDRAHWFYLYVREAHPGERLPPHASYEQKREQAEFFRHADQVPWPVLVDDLEGTTAHAYTTLPNAQFLIDADGMVVFRGDVAHGPTLYRALDRLLQQGGRGAIPDADDSMPHMLGPMTFGWDGIQRGGEVSTHDLWSGAPPMAANLWLGNQMKPLLAPLASRGRPIPTGAKVAAGAVLLGLLLSRRNRRRRSRHAPR